jgi:hypothetical protein
MLAMQEQMLVRAIISSEVAASDLDLISFAFAITMLGLSPVFRPGN